MRKYHVKYYYLATGMEGVADEKDFGMIEAESEKDAMEYVAKYIDKERFKDYPGDECYRLWGLSAKLL